MQCFDKREYTKLHDIIHFCSRKIAEHRPLQLSCRNRLLIIHNLPLNLNLARKNTGIRDTQHHRLLRFDVVHLIQITDKHQIGYLFDHIQGIGQSPRPEYIPERVDFILQITSYH